jgi:8-oxo-dGTP pyrophosphatase MutT (NUDIX family)
MDRHMTVSGFVVHEGHVALHWHRKLAMWLPAGGHIEEAEDPVQAVLREVREEFDLEAEILPLHKRVAYNGGPGQIEPPYVVLDCWPEPNHGHIDYVYFLRCVSGYPGRSHDADNPIHWLDTEMLASGVAAEDVVSRPLAPDVQALGIEAIRLTGLLTPSPSGSG